MHKLQKSILRISYKLRVSFFIQKSVISYFKFNQSVAKIRGFNKIKSLKEN